MNVSTPPNVLAKLSKDKNSHVRWGTAKNISTPVKILEKLAKDRDDHAVSSDAARTLEKLQNKQ